MTRVFYASELEGVATFWRVYRTDGVALGFTTHDKDLWFGGHLHRAAPGMLPSAIRRSADFEADLADVQGALSHDAVSEADLEAGRYDGARVEIGVVDWETLETAVLYQGDMGPVSQSAGGFTAELRSAKAELEKQPLPQTSPTCRAPFCGPGCTLPSERFSRVAKVSAFDLASNSVAFAGGPAPALLAHGRLRWLDGPHAGVTMQVVRLVGTAVVPDLALDAELAVGARAILREGCDHTIATCATRFGNAINFQGEPFLPGSDLLIRYGQQVQ